MIHLCYSLLDKKAGAYSTPFYARTDGEAMRMVTSTLVQGGTSLSQFPNDYHLYAMGEFDDVSGELVSYQKPNPVASVFELLQPIREMAFRSVGEQVDLEEAIDERSRADEIVNSVVK